MFVKKSTYNAKVEEANNLRTKLNECFDLLIAEQHKNTLLNDQNARLGEGLCEILKTTDTLSPNATVKRVIGIANGALGIVKHDA